jgi:protein subunit release factor A
MVPPTIRAQARRALSLPDEALLSECLLEFFVGPGPGGQHRNKTASAVRLRHAPTGTIVTATERRSQVRNRAEAVARLRERLAQLGRESVPRRPTRPTRASNARRLDAKRRTSEKKSMRRGLD